MKTFFVICLLAISFCAASQMNNRLDTVFARYRVFTYDELNFIKGGWTPRDSSQKEFFRKMQAVVKAVPNKQISTLITIDSIPGAISVVWYSNFRSSTEGETAGLTNNIKAQIKGYAPLTSTCQTIDNGFDDKRKNTTKNGKDDW